MAPLTRAILFFSIASFAITVCGAFLSDLVKEFRFIKRNNKSNEFDFSLASDNGTYKGQALKIKNWHFMRVNNDELYWTKFENNELKQTNEFSKSVRIVEQGDDELRFDDYFSKHRIDLNKGKLFITPYNTAWNLTNICFTKFDANNRTFQFIIQSDNNARDYNGTTYIEDEDIPYAHRLKLVDGPRIAVYEVEFTKEELHSNETFCRRISKIISQMRLPAAHIPAQNIDPNALKSLIG